MPTRSKKKTIQCPFLPLLDTGKSLISKHRSNPHDCILPENSGMSNAFAIISKESATEVRTVAKANHSS